jgi:WD40 repeat protein
MHPQLGKLNAKLDEEEADMEGLLECVEWLNVNRNARLKVTAKDDNFKKNKGHKKATAATAGTSRMDSDPNSALYLIHVEGQRFPETNNLVACLSSDQVVNVYEQKSLKERYKIHQRIPQGKNLNEVGFYKQDVHMLYTCGDDGHLRVFDLRLADCSVQLFQKEAVCFSAPTPREFLCADINADDTMFAVGTNKNIDDAMVYLFDVRYSSKHLYQMCESHSMDITQVCSSLYSCSQLLQDALCVG